MTASLAGTAAPISERVALAHHTPGAVLPVRVICAWCLGEGVTTVIQDGPASQPVSHGCCEWHYALLLQEVGVA